MTVPIIQTSFSRGELASSLWGHVDLAAFHTALSTCRNMYVGFRGGVYSRGGTRFVGRSKQNPIFGGTRPRLIKFAFNATQQYVLEFGERYFRIVSRGGFVTETAIAVTGATQASPCTITAAGHDFVNGDWVVFDSGVGGMIELAGNSYIVATSNIGAGTFTLKDLDAVNVSSLTYGAYTSGGTVARIYTVATPYAAADLDALKFAQSADTMSLTHALYPPQELKRLGATHWTIAAADFAAPIGPPAALTATATTNPNPLSSPPTKPCAYAYVATAIDLDTGGESVASPVADVTDSVDMAVTAGSIKLVWSAVDKALVYNLYRSAASYNTNSGSATNAAPVPAGALMGYIGTSFGNEFTDTNIVPDFARTPPLHRNPFAPGAVKSILMTESSADWTTAAVSITTVDGSGFSGKTVISGGAVVAVIILGGGRDHLPGEPLVFTGDGTSAAGTATIGPRSGTYPGVVTYLQQRRTYADSLNDPATYWMSQPGAPLNFDRSIPVNDADAIASTLTSFTVDGIEWMLPMPLGLVTFTQSGVWQIGAPGSFASNPAAITPSNQIAAPQGSIGASHTLPPIKINWDIIFMPPEAATVRSLTYQLMFNTYTAADISWSAAHLLTGHAIQAWAYCEEPYRIVWQCREDGLLLSMTYLKEQEVIGWARHTTQGQVRDLCGVQEPPTDALYLAVERTVGNNNGAGGLTRYFIERMDDRLWQSIDDSWCVDCAVATELTHPAASLHPIAAGGNGVTFDLNPAISDSAWIGRTLRIGGGIAVVRSVPTAGSLVADWLYPCRQIVPDDPAGTPLAQAAGDWSLAGPTSRFGGLLHLAGRQVVALADGVPVGPVTVSATGFIDLPFAASRVVAGLAFTVQGQSLYLDAGNPTVQGRRKTIPAVTLRIENAAPMQVGANQPDASALSPPPNWTAWSGLTDAAPADGPWPATYQTPAAQIVQPLFTGDVRVPIPSDWRKPGQVAWQQSVPVPLAVLAIVPETLEGDVPEPGYSQRPAARERARGE